MFAAEANMTEIVLDRLPRMLGLGSRFAYAIEIPIGYRRVDLALLSMASFSLETIGAARLRRLSLRNLWDIAECLTATPFLPRSLASCLECSELSILGLDLQQSECRELLEFLASAAHPLILVELKLSNWRGALDQARYYLRAGGLSCVVVASDVVPRIPLNDFIDTGIGLFAADPSSLSEIVSPRLQASTEDPQQAFQKLRVIHSLVSHSRDKWLISQEG